MHARDKRTSAEFYSEIFGFEQPVPFGPFLDVETANEVTLAFLETDEDFNVQHYYAFLVNDVEFDAIFARLTARGLTYWADPAQNEPGKINRLFGGRGVYFADPSGNLLEIITRPYGSAE